MWPFNCKNYLHSLLLAAECSQSLKDLVGLLPHLFSVVLPLSALNAGTLHGVGHFWSVFPCSPCGVMEHNLDYSHHCFYILKWKFNNIQCCLKSIIHKNIHFFLKYRFGKILFWILYVSLTCANHGNHFWSCSCISVCCSKEVKIPIYNFN